MNKLLRDIIQSPTAERMRHMVTDGFYDRSRTGLWMFEVIGREYGDMAKWSEELKYEINPQTCTWSISIWEWVYEIESDETLPLEVRRQNLSSKRLSRLPINPARIEATLSFITGCLITVIDPISPYKFHVISDESNTMIIDYSTALKKLRTIKPSHLSFIMEAISKKVYKQTIYFAVAAFEYADITIHLPKIDRTVKTDIYISNAGFEYAEITINPA